MIETPKVDWFAPTRASLPVTVNVRPARLSTVSLTPFSAVWPFS